MNECAKLDLWISLLYSGDTEDNSRINGLVRKAIYIRESVYLHLSTYVPVYSTRVVI